MAGFAEEGETVATGCGVRISGLMFVEDVRQCTTTRAKNRAVEFALNRR